MGFIEGILIGFIAVLVVTVYLLNERISNLSTALEIIVRDTEQHFKEVHYAFMNIATSIELITNTITNQPTSTSAIQEKIDKIKGSAEKFLKLREITEEQLDLFRATQSPSASASHSRYKNEIMSKMKKLEEEKRSIMHSLLDDGIDPDITVLDETGSTKTMKMSEAIKLPVTVEDRSTDSKTPRKKDGNIIKLFDKGDSDDDEDNPRDPTLH